MIDRCAWSGAILHSRDVGIGDWLKRPVAGGIRRLAKRYVEKHQREAKPCLPTEHESENRSQRPSENQSDSRPRPRGFFRNHEGHEEHEEHQEILVVTGG